jgi:hypothetical protein
MVVVEIVIFPIIKWLRDLSLINSKKILEMRQYIILIFCSCIFNFGFGQAECDISTIGLETSAGTIHVGETAILSFPIYNDGTDTLCTIPINSVTAVLTFPSSVFAFDQVLVPSVGAGEYFTWTFDPIENVLVGINHEDIPNGEGEFEVKVQIIGTGVGVAQAILNINQEGEVPNETENDVGGPTFVNVIPAVCTGIVTSGLDSGYETLRYQIGCAESGDTISYAMDVSNTILQQPLQIDKSIVINGISNTSKPVIEVDFSRPAFAGIPYGILILSNSTLTVKDVDFIDRNNPSNISLIQVEGDLRGSTVISKP